MDDRVASRFSVVLNHCGIEAGMPIESDNIRRKLHKGSKAMRIKYFLKVKKDEEEFKEGMNMKRLKY